MVLSLPVTVEKVIILGMILLLALVTPFVAGSFLTGKTAVIIDEDGVTDNSTGISVGFIDWNDITSISRGSAFNTKFVYLYVSNPAYYIKRRRNILVRGMLKMTQWMVKTPIAIGTVTLNIGKEELYHLLGKEMKKRGINKS